MKKIITALLSICGCLLFFNSCDTTLKPDEFELRGTIKGLQEKSWVVLLHQDFKTGKMDTVAKDDVYKSQFQFKGKAATPSLYILISNDMPKGLPLFIEPGKMIVNGDLQKLSETHMSGSKSHDDFSALQSKINEIYKKQESWYKAAELAMMAGKGGEVDSFNSLMEKSASDVENTIYTHGKSNKNSIAFPLILLQNVYYLDPVKYLPLFSEMTDAVKNSEFGVVLKEKLDILDKSSPGKVAPDLTGDNPSGQEISLLSFRGNITLIDFWASWCGPCRNANPELVKTYNQFSSKGFKILGVSLDENEEAWKQAIEEDGLNWSHISDLKGWRSQLAEKYGIQAIPQSILIDKNGVIIGRNLTMKELNAKLQNILP